MNEFVAPALGVGSFHCPFCGTFAHQRWHELCTHTGTRLAERRSVDLRPVRGACVLDWGRADPPGDRHRSAGRRPTCRRTYAPTTTRRTTSPGRHRAVRRRCSDWQSKSSVSTSARPGTT